jgi:hypothetical protein
MAVDPAMLSVLLVWLKICTRLNSILFFLPILSRQEIVDCDTENDGCMGGDTWDVWIYMKRDGI